MSTMSPLHEKSWNTALATQYTSGYFVNLLEEVNAAYKTDTVFPPKERVFTAFELCPLSKVSVVILGQDPYHKAGQAHGLAFSVPEGIAIPPSLRNIFKEINSDIGLPTPTGGDLTYLTKQGVLLLNSSLTVAAGKPGSHTKLGWEHFTDAVIHTISEKREHVVFLLWGAFAESKRTLIDEQKHLVLSAPHPSPLSAYRGFFGCKHFSQTNTYLKKFHYQPIEWAV